MVSFLATSCHLWYVDCSVIAAPRPATFDTSPGPAAEPPNDLGEDMRTYAHARMLALLAALALAVAAAEASAESLSVSSQTFRATWAAVTFSGAFSSSTCPVTLEGSFHARSMLKTANSLIGYVTRAATSRCSSGSATILTASLPWHVRYTSFSGTLPNITALNLSVAGAGINVREPVFGVECLLSGGVMTFAMNREAGGNLTSVGVGGTIPTSCGSNASVSGSSNTLTVQGAATRIVLSLTRPTGVLIAERDIVIPAEQTRASVIVNNTDPTYRADLSGIRPFVQRDAIHNVDFTGCEMVSASGSCTVVATLIGARGGGRIDYEQRYAMGGENRRLTVRVSS
jgi:hypothetical protein